MATIRLTEATWYDREYARVKAVLMHRLTRSDMDGADLARELKRYLVTEYTDQELAAFRDNLETDGIIEVI